MLLRLAVVCLCLNLPAWATTLTTISDTIRNASGQPRVGSIAISNTAFSESDGTFVSAGTRTVTLGPAGSFTVQLYPTDQAAQGGTVGSGYYTVTYQFLNGSTTSELWRIPTTAATLTIASVRVSNPAELRPPQGDTLPVTCKTGDLFYNTAATPPTPNLNVCTAPNTWTIVAPIPPQPGTYVADPGASGLVYRSGSGTARIAVSGDISTALGYIPLSQAANLSDILNKSTALLNLGLTGSAPTQISSSTTGNAATATAFANAPTQCGANQYAIGISVTGACIGSQVQWNQIGNAPSFLLSSSAGAANGTAQLDASGHVPLSQLLIPYSSIQNTPSLSAVATSGLYNDLLGKPTALPPNGIATGDLGGSYPNPTVTGINGTLLSSLNSGLLAIQNGTGAPHTATPGDVTGTLGYTPPNPANNLSEYGASAAIARTNLGIGSIATHGADEYLADSGGPGFVFRSPTEGQTRVASSNDLLGLLGYTPENTADKGAVNGYAPLDGNLHLPLANLTPQIPFSYLTGVPNYVLEASINAANGIASLDGNAKVPLSELEPQPLATVTTQGEVIPDGTSILVNGSGQISVNDSRYEAALGYTPEDAAKKDQAGGYAGLTANGLLALSELPSIPFTLITGVPDYVPSANVGKPNGVAPLGPDGVISGNYLPPQPVATSNTPGLVKPDNSTITVNNGTLTVNGGLYDAAGTAASAVSAIPSSGPSQTQAALITPSDWATFNGKQNALGFTPENAANKGVANGYASLDAAGNLAQTATAVQLSSITLPACDSSVRGKIAFTPGSGTTADQFFGCMNTGSNAYSWMPLTGGTPGGGPTGTPLFNFSNSTNVSWTHGLASINLVASVWDSGGDPIGYSNFQLIDANDASLTFSRSQTAGAVKVSPSAYNQSFTSATSVTVTHNLNSLNIIPVVYDSGNNIIEPSTFALTDANTAVLTFAKPQSGTIRLLPVANAYTQTFSASTSVTVTHGLNSTQLALAVYDSSNNLIGYGSFMPSDANTATLSFATAQAGRVVVVRP